MTTSLFLKSASFEPVYGWLEDKEGVVVQVWGVETSRRMALLAYGEGAADAFGWSNWVSAAYGDPSELALQFEQLELVAEADVTTSLSLAFPGVFLPSQPQAG